MSSLKRKKTETTEVQEESYIDEISTEKEATPYEAQHPMLSALEAHFETAVARADHLERYTEVTPFE